MANGAKVTTKKAKKAKYVATGKVENGLAQYQAKQKIGKDNVIEYVFNAPATLADAVKHADAEKWYRMLVLGAMATAAKAVRAQNDTFILWRGERTNALDLKPAVLARMLTQTFQAIIDKTEANAAPDFGAKLSTIARMAIERKIVTRTDAKDEDGAAVVTFAPVK